MVNSAIGYPRGLEPGHSGGAGHAAQPARRPAASEGRSQEAVFVLSHLVTEAPGAVPITPVTAGELAARAGTLDERARAWIKATGFTGKPGKLALLPAAEGGLARVLVGVAASEDPWALAGLPDALPEGSYRLDPEPDAAAATRLTLGWALGCYAFTRYKPRKRGFADLLWPRAADRGLVERLARGIALARDLINTPAEHMGPAELAGAVEELAARNTARCRIISGEALLAENYPMIHAVGRASARPPALADLTWGGEGAPKLTLVGKGVCFDSGGLDLKPASGMRLMKKDMGGAAHALALAGLIAGEKLPVRLHLLIPAVENAVSGTAYRPGDIVKSRQGLTVEVGNTDAEGRLILA